MNISIVDYIGGQSDKVICWQKNLTSIPAIGPENNGTGEYLKASWLTNTLLDMGITKIIQAPSKDDRVPEKVRPNIIATIQGLSSKTLWVISHMDVVPEGDLSLWQTNPFNLHVDGDKIYGRGVEDNQQGIVSSLLVADALLHFNKIPVLSLGLIFVSDEETGMSHGLPAVLKQIPNLISKDDLVLIPDMGNETGDSIEIAEKSCLWLKFTVTGKQCHASRPDNGVNTLIASSDCILNLQQLYRFFSRKDELFKPSYSTFVPSKKELNVSNINTLPGKDIFYMDCRILPYYSVDDVIKKCEDICKETEYKYNVSIEIEVVSSLTSGTNTSPDSEVVKKLSSSLKELRGLDAKLIGSGGVTLASVLRNMGIQCAAWSTLIANAHEPNECSSISNTIKDAQIIANMLCKER